jgi:formylglycine-generating enzyme required for sulfatase activity
VQRCKADGVLEADEVIEMYLAADDYLKLNPRHPKIQEMHAQLAVRMEKPSLMAKVSASRFSPELLAQLPVSVFPNLPVSVLSTLPVDIWLKLPEEVLCRLPAMIWPIYTNSINMKFKLLPAGTFGMGSTNRSDRKAYVAEMTLKQGFGLGIYEVTQEQYQKVMGTNPSKFRGQQNPVEQVSWDEAVEFCRRLSALPAEHSVGHQYRLPTELEWVYACRAGTETDYSFDDSKEFLWDYAWYGNNSEEMTHAVGLKHPNNWGFYDMHGNVWEWCSDTDGCDPQQGGSGSVHKPFRGGSWQDDRNFCWPTFCIHREPSCRAESIGFRVALSPFGIPK